MSNVDVLVIQISGPLCGKHQMILWLSLLHPDPSPFLTQAIRKVNREIRWSRAGTQDRESIANCINLICCFCCCCRYCWWQAIIFCLWIFFHGETWKVHWGMVPNTVTQYNTVTPPVWVVQIRILLQWAYLARQANIGALSDTKRINLNGGDSLFPFSRTLLFFHICAISFIFLLFLNCFTTAVFTAC